MTILAASTDTHTHTNMHHQHGVEARLLLDDDVNDHDVLATHNLANVFCLPQASQIATPPCWKTPVMASAENALGVNQDRDLASWMDVHPHFVRAKQSVKPALITAPLRRYNRPRASPTTSSSTLRCFLTLPSLFVILISPTCVSSTSPLAREPHGKHGGSACLNATNHLTASFRRPRTVLQDLDIPLKNSLPQSSLERGIFDPRAQHDLSREDRALPGAGRSRVHTAMDDKATVE